MPFLCFRTRSSLPRRKNFNHAKEKVEACFQKSYHKKSFSRILKNDLRKNDLAFRLLNEIGIASNMDSYGIDILPIIQDFYDKRYPGLTLLSGYFRNLMLNVKDCIELSLSTSLQKLFGKALCKENIIFHCYTTITILMG